ncbi:androgen-dependent TFPI-regulating protein isoform X2 [Oryctolagus cuniculus]|uniref:androgen-dependent TFPI-regulating protein isoform X2 n=1 Tax=Oryctolagus cuniculus TaxID=9986 RepID=UPI0038790791
MMSPNRDFQGVPASLPLYPFTDRNMAFPSLLHKASHALSGYDIILLKLCDDIMTLSTEFPRGREVPGAPPLGQTPRQFEEMGLLLCHCTHFRTWGQAVIHPVHHQVDVFIFVCGILRLNKVRNTLDFFCLMLKPTEYSSQLLQAIFFGVACLDDVLKRITGRKNIKFVTAFRDLLFTTLAFPVSTFIFLSFWTIFLYNRELVYPRSADAIFPVWLNHAMHTSIVPLSLLEIVLRPHHYPSRKAGLTLLAAGSLAYISRVLWIYSETGKWVYPVFAKLSPVGLAVFFSLSFVLSAGIYLFGEKLNHWKWGDMMQPRKKRK